MVYFTHVKPFLSRVGTFTVKFTESTIHTIEGIIVSQILIAIGKAADSDIVGMTGKILLVLLFISIYVRILKAANYFHYEIIKKRLFNNAIDNFSYILLYLIAIATWPFSAKAFDFLIDFSEAIGVHVGYFINAIDPIYSESDTSP